MIQIRVNSLTQWDYGQTVIFTGANAAASYHVQYAVRYSDAAISLEAEREGTTVTADIPDFLLEQAYPVTVYLYEEIPGRGRTTYTFTLAITPRAKPIDYVYKRVLRLIGDLAVLSTENKDSLVAAVNEIYETGGPEADRRLTALEAAIVLKQEGYLEQKVADFLGYMEMDVRDYAYATDYLLHEFNPELFTGACSAVRNGIYVGRNYDLHYDEHHSVAVRSKPVGGHYGSVGVATNLVSDPRVIPFCLCDGVNSEHLFAEINILQQVDRRSVTTGTNPGKPDVPIAMLVRRILDECASVDEAMAKIADDWNIIVPSSGEFGTEYHFLIADLTKTVVLEFIDNAPVFVEQFVDDKPISTNHYLTGYDGTRESLDTHAMGIERAAILVDGYTSAGSEAGMRALLDQVLYTRAYSAEEDPVWYSEFSGITPTFGDLTKDSTPAEYAPILAYARGLFADRSRSTGLTWITMHSCVYNLQTCSFTVRVQELEDEYYFAVEQLGKAATATGDHRQLTHRYDADQHSIDAITGLTAALAAKADATAMGALAEDVSDIGESVSDIGGSVINILEKIPPAATSDNRLADKNWVSALLNALTAASVGLGSVVNERQYSAQNPPPYPVLSVNGKSGAVLLSPADLGIGNVFTLKGSKATVSALPASGNSYGDVWYVVSDSVGYIWLNDGSADRWEMLGLSIDLSSYRTAAAQDAIDAQLQPKTVTSAYFTSTTIEGILDEIGAEIMGINELAGPGVGESVLDALTRHVETLENML